MTTFKELVAKQELEKKLLQKYGKGVLQELIKNEEDKRKQPYVTNPDHPQKIGKTFEDEIDVVCQLYHSMNVAHIEKTHAPTLFLPKKGNREARMIYLRKTTCDFIGTCKNQDGIWQPIFIETKTTYSGSLPLYQDKTGLKKAQIEKMLWFDNNGIPAYILWKIRMFSQQQVFMLTISEILKYAGERKSLSIDELLLNDIRPLIKKRYGMIEVYDFLNKL